MKKSICLILCLIVIPISQVSAQTGTWQTFSASDGDILVLFTASEDTAVRFELDIGGGGIIFADLRVESEDGSYTERYVSASEEYIFKATRLTLTFGEDISSGRYRVTEFDSLVDALFEDFSSTGSIAILLGGPLFMFLMLLLSYATWRRS